MAHRVLRRPVHEDELDEYLHDLRVALEEIGVARGQHFVVVPKAEVESRPKARATDPATSRKASLDNLPRRDNQHGKLLEVIALAPDGMTAEEACKAAGDLRLNSGSTRLSELVRAGWLDFSEDDTRPTTSGSEAGIYRASKKAMDERERGEPWNG